MPSRATMTPWSSFARSIRILCACWPAYFLIGADRDDLIQEGMIGLYKAIRDYREDHNSSFASFAELCITRQILSAINASRRQKHQPLNSYISLYRTPESGDRELLELIEQPGGDRRSVS